MSGNNYIVELTGTALKLQLGDNLILPNLKVDSRLYIHVFL